MIPTVLFSLDSDLLNSYLYGVDQETVLRGLGFKRNNISVSTLFSGEPNRDVAAAFLPPGAITFDHIALCFCACALLTIIPGFRTAGFQCLHIKRVRYGI